MKKMIKTRCVLALTAPLSVGLCLFNPQIVAAANIEHHSGHAAPAARSYGPQIAVVGQVPVYGGGIFGPTQSQLFMPGPTMFGGAIQTAPAGNVMGEPYGAVLSAPPMVPPQWQGQQYENGMNAGQDLGAGSSPSARPPTSSRQPFGRQPSRERRPCPSSARRNSPTASRGSRAPRTCSPVSRQSKST